MTRWIAVAALLLIPLSTALANQCDSAGVDFQPPSNWCASSYSCSGQMHARITCSTQVGSFSYPGYGHLEIYTSVQDTVMGMILIADLGEADASELEVSARWDEWLNHCYAATATGSAFDYDSESYILDGQIGGGSDCCECSLWTRKQGSPGRCWLARLEKDRS